MSLLNYFGLDPFLWFIFKICSFAYLFLMKKGKRKGHVSILPLCFIKKSLIYLLLSKQMFQVWRWNIYWFLVLSGLMLIACLFLCGVELVGTIFMVKGVSKVSFENRFNRIGRTWCFHVNFFCFNYFYTTLTANFLTTAYKSKIIRFKMDEDLL